MIDEKIINQYKLNVLKCPSEYEVKRKQRCTKRERERERERDWGEICTWQGRQHQWKQSLSKHTVGQTIC